jgi:hypothetical protein
MKGDYPSTDFEIVDEGGIRKVLHLPSGMLIETGQLRADPVAVSGAYRLAFNENVIRPAEIVQASLRHLRVWLMRNYQPRRMPRAGRAELTGGTIRLKRP